MKAPQDQTLVVMTRGGISENEHRGRISVVSAIDGREVYTVGDVDVPTYVRSTAKPMQAIASLGDGMAEAYGFESRHLALMGASHRGSPEQIAVLEEILALTGVPEDALAVGATLPVGSRNRDKYVAAGGRPRKLFHTCAGKHLGVLAWSKLKGWPLEGYIHPDHPAQREVLGAIARWTGEDASQVTVGRDGCGFPVAAMPLRRLAFGYGRLASPELALAGGVSAADVGAATAVTQAMNAHPLLVEGDRRLASLLLADPNVVAKSGAHGVFTFGLRREQLGVAFTVSNGTEIAWPYVAMALLDKFGGVSAETRQRLADTFPAEFLNDAREKAGKWEVMLP
ncbi:asparaginase [Cohnella yongneupensis]|uniref:Asparaginase n=1 Tax=Cohnella yongneupensis TaxID=425006 RepID=A0ABW0R2D3_9BACL